MSQVDPVEAAIRPYFDAARRGFETSIEEGVDDGLWAAIPTGPLASYISLTHTQRESASTPQGKPKVLVDKWEVHVNIAPSWATEQDGNSFRQIFFERPKLADVHESCLFFSRGPHSAAANIFFALKSLVDLDVPRDVLVGRVDLCVVRGVLES